VRIFINLLLLGATVFASQNITISQKQQNDLGIKVQEITVVGTVDFGPYNGMAVLDKKDMLSVSSNVEAIVKEIYVRKFSPVKKGDKLLTLQSNALLGMQREYIDSLIENKNSTQNYNRDVKLESEGIIAKKVVLASEQLKRSSDLRVQLNAAQLLTNGFTKDMLKKLANTQTPIKELTLYSSVNGVVYEIDANVGEYVSADKNLMLIYGDGKRYLELDVPVDIAGSLSLGDIAEFASHEAIIVAVSNIVNPQNQSVKIRAAITDAKGIFINKVYDVRIYKNVDTAFKVKKSSLVFSDNKPYLFKKTETGFEVLDVTIIQERTQCYVVSAELHAGDSVAATSTAALLSAMEEKDE
jgi:cobalt-zinc-cadmium efflux system membrane fusion protein